MQVAVKLLPMNGNCQKTWNKIGGEAVLLAKVSERCKSTSRLYGICLKDDNFCLVMKKYAISLKKKMDNYPGNIIMPINIYAHVNCFVYL